MKAAVVGVGKLGGTVAWALARDGAWDEVVLHDVVGPLARAQAEDVRNGLPADLRTEVRAGDLDDAGGAEVVVLVAGAGRKPGMTRLDLLQQNAPVVASLARRIAEAAPRTTIVVLTNPVDVMTVLAQRASGFPRERVAGSGAAVDSARLRGLIARRSGVHPWEVDATVLGEHGDRAVPVFSRALVRGEPARLSPQEQEEIRMELLELSGRIIESKDGTAFGPAGCTAALARALVGSKPAVVPASVVLDGEYGIRDIALGVPAIVGKGRVLAVEQWDLLPDESAALGEAGRELRGFVDRALHAGGVD